MGAVNVKLNDAILLREGDGIAAIEVDMRTKRADVGSFGSEDGVPNLHLHANEYSLYTDTDHTGWTDVAFPDYKGWDIFAASVSKYTLSVCLVRRPTC
jgi:hypothetical protein